MRDDDSEEKEQAMAMPLNQPSKPKIASWDIRGKLKHAEENIIVLKEKVAEFTLVTSNQRQEHEELKNQNIVLEVEINAKTATLDSIKRQLLHNIENLELLNFQYAECDLLCEETASALQNVTHSLEIKEERLRSLREEMAGLKAAYREQEAALLNQQGIATEKEASLIYHKMECAALQESLRDQEEKRKVLNNRVMELKGNIRVFCRVRPLLSSETSDQKSVEHLAFNDENSLDVIKGHKGIKISFSFDRVFSPRSSQSDIFEELSELIQSVIDGYNVCVFAYGQTGSGKTFTMEGGFGEEERGMIPRSIDHIFQVLDNLALIGWNYKVEASFLEIYNEHIRDLLDVGQTEKCYEIRNPLTAGGDMLITNLKVEVVTSATQVNSLLNIAKTNRAVATTARNDHSSRSHFVFKLRLMGENAMTAKSSDAVLSLVDLAGSERLSEVSVNARVMETKNINRSLSNIGNVILSLSNKNEHVPYRNSKLTHMLQTSLGGNSKTLMIVTISPREEFIEETLNSLRFASRVNQCHIGKARRQARQ